MKRIRKRFIREYDIFDPKTNYYSIQSFILIDKGGCFNLYKWLFDDDSELPPPQCIGGNDNFKPSVDEKGNLVWVLKSSNKYPKGVLMNMDNTCVDRETGKKGSWSCTEESKEPTVQKESIDDILNRFSFLINDL